MTCPLLIQRHPIAENFQNWLYTKGYTSTTIKRCGIVATEVCDAYPDLNTLPKDIDIVIRKLRGKNASITIVRKYRHPIRRFYEYLGKVSE